MSSEKEQLRDRANESGKGMTTRFFEKRGNHSEVHVDRNELASLLALAYEVGAESETKILTEFVRSIADYDRYAGYDESEPAIVTLKRILAEIEHDATKLLSKAQIAAHPPGITETAL